ncbi:acyl carrier protein [Salinispora vitiensis]|uniref:acyl carrier protein n=1 Tax=Salinispora vitiensis TaxID=999544 RepID=UPI0003686135|nr:acyl carrier protein [Salinispora vitiensis]
MTQVTNPQLAELREIAAEVLEVEPEELTETGLFGEEYDADSLRAIELLARIEKRFKVDIPQTELPNMIHLRATYDVVAKYAGWS